MSAGFTSDEEYDKIGYKAETSRTPAYTNASHVDYQEFVYSFAHGMGEQPLPDAIFSINGTDYYTSGETIVIGGVPGTGGAGYYFVRGFVDADTTNINVVIGSNYNTSIQVYFKLSGEYKI